MPESQLAQRVDEALDFFDLSRRANDRVTTFSRGMKQRLALARALIHEPPLLFLDEPTSGLDPEAARHVTQMIQQLSHQQGRTVCLCTHNLNEAQRLCDRVAVMNQGRLLAPGAPVELARTLWSGVWVDIEFRAPLADAVADALWSVRGVSDVQRDGERLAVRVVRRCNSGSGGVSGSAGRVDHAGQPAPVLAGRCLFRAAATATGGAVMHWRVLRTIAIALKDLKEVAQNRAALVPAIIVPLVFIVLLPLFIILAPALLDFTTIPLFSTEGPVQMMKENIPALADELAGLNEQQAWIVLMIGYFFALFMLILPLMLSTIVAADSFVGEKERKTIEALIYTPASDTELFLGKMLASVAPAVALGWLGFLVYGVVVNGASWHAMGRIWFPPAAWRPLMLWVAPAIAVLGMAVTVMISARVQTFMEAYQISGSLVVLVLALVIGQVTGVLYMSVGVALAVGLALWLIDAAMIWLGMRTMAREALLARR